VFPWLFLPERSVQKQLSLFSVLPAEAAVFALQSVPLTFSVLASLLLLLLLLLQCGRMN